MSHNIYTSSYVENVDRRKVFDYWNRIAARENRGEGGHGLCKDIRWYDFSPIQADYETAEKFIKANDQGWYDQLAVRYYESINHGKTSQKIEELRHKRSDIYERIVDYDRHFCFEGHKSKYVACKKCGSKLSVEYLAMQTVLNYCPLCNEDLHSETAKKHHDKLNDKLKIIDAQIDSEYKKLLAKGKKNVCWLVKVEWHT